MLGASAQRSAGQRSRGTSCGGCLMTARERRRAPLAGPLHVPLLGHRHNSLELHRHRHSSTLRAALVRTLITIPISLRKSITWDQGTEMVKHLDIDAETGMPISLCDAASPWQLGTVENTNWLPASSFRRAPTDLGCTIHRDGRNRTSRRPRAICADVHPRIASERCWAHRINHSFSER